MKTFSRKLGVKQPVPTKRQAAPAPANPVPRRQLPSLGQRSQPEHSDPYAYHPSDFTTSNPRQLPAPKPINNLQPRKKTKLLLKSRNRPFLAAQPRKPAALPLHPAPSPPPITYEDHYDAPYDAHLPSENNQGSPFAPRGALAAADPQDDFPGAADGVQEASQQDWGVSLIKISSGMSVEYLDADDLGEEESEDDDDDVLSDHDDDEEDNESDWSPSSQDGEDEEQYQKKPAGTKSIGSVRQRTVSIAASRLQGQRPAAVVQSSSKRTFTSGADSQFEICLTDLQTGTADLQPARGISAPSQRTKSSGGAAAGAAAPHRKKSTSVPPPPQTADPKSKPATAKNAPKPPRQRNLVKNLASLSSIPLMIPPKVARDPSLTTMLVELPRGVELHGASGVIGRITGTAGQRGQRGSTDDSNLVFDLMGVQYSTETIRLPTTVAVTHIVGNNLVVDSLLDSAMRVAPLHPEESVFSVTGGAYMCSESGEDDDMLEMSKSGKGRGKAAATKKGAGAAGKRKKVPAARGGVKKNAGGRGAGSKSSARGGKK